MADLKAFEAEVKNKIKELSSKNASTRLKAAQWLGEAGEPFAITKLTQAYKNDSDSRVREAAKYSLGMFRALENALSSDKEEEILVLLQKVAEEGKRGRRVPIPTRTLVKFEIVLLALLVILLGVNFVVLPGLRSSGQPEPTRVVVNNKDRVTLLAELHGQYIKIRDNTNTLQAQYQSVLGSDQANCQVFFNDLSVFELSGNDRAAFPEINDLAQRLNAVLADFSTAKQPYENYCNAGNPLSVSEVSGPMGILIEVVAQLSEIEASLTVLETAPTATIPPTETPVLDTPIPEATPQPTVNARPHLQELQRIIDDVNAPSGAKGLLKTYWNDVMSSGQTAGCDEVPPPIPADHFLSPGDAELNPVLGQVVSMVNQGLAGVRTGWTQFKQACSSNSLRASAESGLQVLQSAETNFGAALDLFDAAMQGG
jgi:hypothetical protein